jgi:phosphatidylserine decarboxylase
MADEIERRSMPWLNVVFDWEGVAAAAAAFLAALLLGWIWSPLFWIGFTAMVAALAAGRWSRRTPPDIVDGVVAPCDGIVLSIERSEPPTALRLSTEDTVRVRISSSPIASNKLYTPIAGGVDLISLAQGEPNVPVAFRPDDDGLTRAYVTFESAGEQAGMALATGGLGPRLELMVETGDVVRLGRAFATRRLGGWCDLYLPASMAVLVWPGQTLVGGETVIGRLHAMARPLHGQHPQPRHAQRPRVSRLRRPQRAASGRAAGAASVGPSAAALHCCPGTRPVHGHAALAAPAVKILAMRRLQASSDDYAVWAAAGLCRVIGAGMPGGGHLVVLLSASWPVQAPV